MKKAISLLLALAMCLSLCACGAGDDEALNLSREAFNKITEAYVILNEFSQDIYTAWYLGIHSSGKYDGYKGYDFEKYNREEFNDFCDEMRIDQMYIEEAVVNLSNAETFNTGAWFSLAERYNGSFFSAWVSVILEAYVCSGDVENTSSLLNEAKTIIKTLSDEYSDYEHYPVLKEYFTNALAYFDCCQNPEGSFEQIMETFNNYQSIERKCFFELDYIFEESSANVE